MGRGMARYAYEYDAPYKHQESFKRAEKEAEKHERRIGA